MQLCDSTVYGQQQRNKISQALDTQTILELCTWDSLTYPLKSFPQMNLCLQSCFKSKKWMKDSRYDTLGCWNSLIGENNSTFSSLNATEHEIWPIILFQQTPWLVIRLTLRWVFHSGGLMVLASWLFKKNFLVMWCEKLPGYLWILWFIGGLSHPQQKRLSRAGCVQCWWFLSLKQTGIWPTQHTLMQVCTGLNH